MVQCVEHFTREMELRLPGEKLSCLHKLIDMWTAKHPTASVKKRDLASLAGHLQHASIYCAVSEGGFMQCKHLLYKG